MRIARHGDWVVLHPPAKLNLFLEVLEKRPDGFHEIETLMAAVDWRDTLQLRPSDGEAIHFQARWRRIPGVQGAPGDLPQHADNIVVRAIELFRQRAGVTQGAEVRLWKRIPSAAGLGGASSDAAAALLAANAAWQLGWSRPALAEVAAELGSDIPFFLKSSVAICRGRGEQIQPMAAFPPLDVVVVRPPEGLSTPQVYKNCLPAAQPKRVEPLLTAWRRGDYASLARNMTNGLEAAAEKLSPWIARLRERFAEQGCWGHQMSGSGSSYFGLCRHAAHARQVAARLRAANIGYVMCTRTLGRSEETIKGRQAA